MSAVEFEAGLQIMPVMDAETRRALRDSIVAHGVLVPIVVDQHGRIIDGHNRAEIADELGVPVDRVVRQVESEDEAIEVARTLNLDRRHLQRDTRVALALHLRKQRHSLRAIAGALGVSQTQVANDLTEYQVSTDFTPDNAGPQEDQTTEGVDGKQYPATRRFSDADKDAAVARFLAGETQSALAEELGVSQSAVSAWVRARRDSVPKPATGNPKDRTRAGLDARVDEIRRRAAQGYSSRQLEAQFGIGQAALKRIITDHDIDVPADRVVSRTRRLDSNRVVEGVIDLLPVDGPMLSINLDDLDGDRLEGWVISLSDAIRSLTTLRNNLKKEMTSRAQR